MDDHEERAELSSEPVRSRWSPKPEQILILESIFNSGMVNPPKDETVRIRRMLEKFGSVGDANVFYWFQNRRSRSRRRQRQIQAAAAAAAAAAEEQPIHYANTETANNFSTSPIVSNYPMINTAGPGSSSSFGLASSDGYLSFSGHPAGLQQLHQNFGPPDTSNSHCHSVAGMITVFINGVATEVGRGPLDLKAMFGGDYALVHSSGVGVELNENGFLVHSLRHGESYFLVPRHS